MADLSTLLADASEVRAYNAAKKGGSVPSSFEYRNRGKHFTLNGESSPTSPALIVVQSETMEESLMNGSAPPPQSAPTTANGTGFFFVSLHGTTYPFSNPLGLALYSGCGRTIRRAMHNPLLLLSKISLTMFIFFFCWYIMHFGGALATFRFPRMDQVRLQVSLNFLTIPSLLFFFFFFFFFFFLQSPFTPSLLRRPSTPNLCRTW